VIASNEAFSTCQRASRSESVVWVSIKSLPELLKWPFLLGSHLQKLKRSENHRTWGVLLSAAGEGILKNGNAALNPALFKLLASHTRLYRCSARKNNL
jgi:hypothetical protein